MDTDKGMGWDIWGLPVQNTNHEGFGKAEPWSQDRDLRFESMIREETTSANLVYFRQLQ